MILLIFETGNPFQIPVASATNFPETLADSVGVMLCFFGTPRKPCSDQGSDSSSFSGSKICNSFIAAAGTSSLWWH